MKMSGTVAVTRPTSSSTLNTMSRISFIRRALRQ
jgi:hypothetical protein